MLLIDEYIIQQTKREFEFSYYGDLFYFSAFQYLNRDNSLMEGVGDFDFFKQFLYEYRVSRKIKADFKPRAWEEFKQLAKKEITTDTVDHIAKSIFIDLDPNRGINTSLCSKILMLLKPSLIIPIDSLNKEALNFNKNEYKGFYQKLKIFEKEYHEQISSIMAQVDSRAKQIESIYKDQFEEIESIRKNRIIDKLLVQIGRSILDNKEELNNAARLHKTDIHLQH